MEIRGWVVAARCSCRLSLRGPAAPSSRSRRMTRARTRRPTRGEAVEGCAGWPSGVGGLPLRPHAPGARAGTALGHPLRPRRDALHPHLLGGAQRDDARPGQVRQQGRPGQAHRRRARLIRSALPKSPLFFLSSSVVTDTTYIVWSSSDLVIASCVPVV
uniref:Uncharacterized protein n=1 Tax=Aegilops tauschii subsp. strangulata TaxID=200361 RepID=A0A453HWG5_AEGTS